MHSIAKLGGALCLSALMAACTTTRPYNLIDAEARPHIQEMDSVIISKQSQVRADIKTSQLSRYVQGHFAPVLFDLAVNGIRTHQAKKIIQPIHATLDGYDYTQDIKEEFAVALEETELGDMGDLTLMLQEQPGFRAAYIRNSDADAVMFIDVDFAFTPNFDALHLTSRVMVFPITAALSPFKERPDTDNIVEFEDNIYRNQFISAIPARAELDSSKSENGAAWAELSEEELTGLMQSAAQKIATHIAHDLSTDDVSQEALEQEALEQEDTKEDAAEEVIEAAVDPALSGAQALTLN